MIQIIFKNPIILAIIAGIISFIIMYIYNKYCSKSSSKSKKKQNIKIDIIPVLFISLIVWFVSTNYFENNITDTDNINNTNNITSLKEELLEYQNRNAINDVDELPDIISVLPNDVRKMLIDIKDTK